MQNAVWRSFKQLYNEILRQGGKRKGLDCVFINFLENMQQLKARLFSITLSL